MLEAIHGFEKDYEPIRIRKILESRRLSKVNYEIAVAINEWILCIEVYHGQLKNAASENRIYSHRHVNGLT